MKMLDLTTNPYKMSKVNLDALIPKADFIDSGKGNKKKSGIDKLFLFHLLKENDLSIYNLLKKPDFQRETNEWDKKRIADLIECFIERNFIPSIILWENDDTGLIYVIDGAHRLSAILAYVNNDYGFGSISHEFNGYVGIPEEEKELARETENYINGKIGSYEEVIKGGGTRADGLKKAYFDVQMITGDVKKAEDSFFKINAQGVVLSPTEKILCKFRDYPTCLSTRIAIKGSAGHQYWKGFDASLQKNVMDIAIELHKLLFEPPFKEETKSTILGKPLGGSLTNAMPMIFELMKLIKEKYKKDKKEEGDSFNGSETLDYLTWTRKLIWKTLSEKSGSLGLHPVVYFYNSGGKYIHSAFLGMMQLLLEYDGTGDNTFLPKFTKVRCNLEQFLIKYKIFLGQINARYGSKERSFRHLKGFYITLISYFDEEYPKPFIECEQTVLLKVKEKYPLLNERDSEIEPSKSRRFSGESKSFLRIKEELHAAPRCKICNGILHPFSTDYDHILDRKKDGGSEIENAQSAHYYCNNSKDKLIDLGIYMSPA